MKMLNTDFECQCRDKTPALLPVLSLKNVLRRQRASTQMHWRRAYADGSASGDLRDDERAKRLADTRPSCAVSRNRNSGTASMFGVRPDRFDH